MLSNELQGADQEHTTGAGMVVAGSLVAWGVALVGALLLVSAGGWAWGGSQLWAFRFFLYIPWPWRLLMALAILLSAYAPLTAAIARLRYPVFRDAIAHRAFDSLLILLSGLCFWLWQERTWRGDALLKVKLLAEQTLQSDPYVWKEPLDSLLAYSTTALARRFALPPESAVAGWSIVAGMLYVWALLYAARFLADRDGRRLRLVGALLALGSTQLWFGHIENYSLVTACSFVTLVWALGYLRGVNRLWPVGLAAGLAVCFHPQAIFVMPALLWLPRRPAWWRQLATLAATALLGPLITLALMAAQGVPWPSLSGGYAGDSKLFLTLGEALAPAHLWDVANTVWLVAPLAPLWLVIGIWALRLRTVRRDRCFQLLSVATAGLLAYLLFFQNDLPRPRDWDLFAIVGPGLTLWGWYAWEKWLAPSGVLRAERVATAWPALLFAAFFATGWIGVNHTLTLIHPNSDERAVYARYRLLDLLTLLPTAQVTPPEPICAEAVGCERVAATSFTMPQNGDTRPVLFAHAPSRIVLPLPVLTDRTFLWLSPMLDPASWGWGGDGVTFQVSVEQEGAEQVLWTHHYTPADFTATGWQEVFVSLAPFRGQRVDLVLTTAPGPTNNDAGDRAGWGLPWLMRGTVEN